MLTISVMMVVGWFTSTMTSSTTKSPYKATQFLFKYMKKKWWPTRFSDGSRGLSKNQENARKQDEWPTQFQPLPRALRNIFQKVVSHRSFRIVSRTFSKIVFHRNFLEGCCPLDDVIVLVAHLTTIIRQSGVEYWNLDFLQSFFVFSFCVFFLLFRK